MRRFLLCISLFFLFSLPAISQLPTCNGTPDGGFTNAVSDSVCSGVPFTLSVAGATTGVSGLTYQWQSSTDSISWDNIATAVDDSLTTSQTTSNYYRRIIYCGANSDTSIAILTSIKRLADCYCTLTPSVCIVGPVILNVSMGTLINNSLCSQNGYIDYSANVAAANVYIGISKPIAVTVGNAGIQHVALWIDYNHNSVFETNEYSFVGTGDGVTINSLINVPSTAIPGLTKMRVRLRYNAALNSSDACSLIAYGETEDYAVDLVIPPPCSGTPTGGNTVSALAAACPADSIILSVAGATFGFAGLTYQWQSSEDSVVWQDIPGKTDLGCIVYQDSIRFYRRMTSCSGNSSFSVPVKVGIKTLLQCYCKPASSICAQGDRITNVSIGSFTYSSSCSPTGFIDYTDSIAPAIVYPGPVNVAVTVSAGGTEHVAAWIDFDRNGIFEPGEYFNIGSGNGVTINNQVVIPSNAPQGITRIRVRLRFNIPLGSSDACTSFPYGETEDYLVNITAVPNLCVPAGPSGCTGGDVITRVVFGTIDTTTACSAGGYGNFTAGTLSAAVAANSFVPVHVETGCNGSNPQFVGVWIDLNHDNIFNRSEFTMIRDNCSTTITDSISIPTNAVAGATTMRIRTSASYLFSSSDACTQFINGETEDYKVVIQPAGCQVNTWTGMAGTNNWEDAGNWSCQQVPSIHSNVQINNVTVNINSNVTVYSLNLNPSARLSVTAPNTLIITH